MSDGMMHIQRKIMSAILDFGKNGKKPPFSAVSQYPDHLEGWLYWRKMLVSLYIGEKILISHIVLHYFKYKMAADVCHSIWDSSSAHRLDGPHVLYIKMIVWFPCWCTCQKCRPSWIFKKMGISYFHCHWSLFTVGRSDENWTCVYCVNSGKGNAKPNWGLDVNKHAWDWI